MYIHSYGAWSGMKTLTGKGLVHKYSSPAKYKLLEPGIELANRLIRVIFILYSPIPHI